VYWRGYQLTLDTKDKNYKWEDHGVVIRSEPGRDNWNAIDPNLIIDENNVPWLAFGSFWSGVKMVRLNDDLYRWNNPSKFTRLLRAKPVRNQETLFP
jgi:arabinan endo-1,5-alpha-L-arabinosidase